jgi:hypothetical protein
MSDEPTTRDPFTPLRAAAVVGLCAAGIGCLTLAGYAGRIAWEAPVAGEMSASVGSEALLVAVEVLLCLVFAVIAAVAVTTRDREAAATYAGLAAAAKPLFSFGIIAANWDPGWYFILDPNGAHPTALLLIAASAIQEILLVVAALRLGAKRSARTEA